MTHEIPWVIFISILVVIFIHQRQRVVPHFEAERVGFLIIHSCIEVNDKALMASKCLFMCAHRLHVSGFRKLTWKQVWRCFSSYMLEIFQVFLLVPGLYWSLFSLFYQCDLRQKWIKYARLYALCNIRTLYRSSWICQSCAVLNCCGPFSGKMPRILVRKHMKKVIFASTCCSCTVTIFEMIHWGLAWWCQTIFSFSITRNWKQSNWIGGIRR